MMNKMKIFLIVFVFMFGTSSYLCAQNSPLKEAYNGKQKAVKSLNIDEVSKYLTKDQVSQLRKTKDVKAAIFLIDYQSPIEYSMGEERVEGNTAFMNITGKARNPKAEGKVESFQGIVTFKKEGSAWKIYSEEKKFPSDQGDGNTWRIYTEQKKVDSDK